MTLPMESLLTQQPFFAVLSLPHLQTLAAHARRTEYDSDHFLLLENGAADRFYLLLKGDVALSTYIPGRGHMTIQTLHDGDVLGWSWMFPPYRWHFDARTVGPVSVIEFSAEGVRGACDRDHELGYQLMHRFAQIMLHRLQTSRLRLLDIYLPTAGAAPKSNDLTT